MEIFYSTLVFAFGAIVGSFLNVCVYRMPREESLAFPGSHCVHCNKPIHWYDNVPVLSYLILFGKCRSCGKPISFRYVIVEVLSALAALALFVKFGVSANFFLYYILTAGLIIATFIDFEYQIIPDSISISGIFLGLIAAAIFPSLMEADTRLLALGRSLLGAVVGGGSIYAIGVLGSMAFKKDAMGGGDVKLMAALGAILGWKLVVVIFFMAPCFGSVIGIIEKIKYKKETIPYGPYLALAATIAIFWGDMILRYFQNLYFY